MEGERNGYRKSVFTEFREISLSLIFAKNIELIKVN